MSFRSSRPTVTMTSVLSSLSVNDPLVLLNITLSRNMLLEFCTSILSTFRVPALTVSEKVRYN